VVEQIGQTLGGNRMLSRRGRNFFSKLRGGELLHGRWSIEEFGRSEQWLRNPTI
jgi:hypothetical protein